MRLIQRAANIAYEAHKGQFRKYGHSMDPYVLHPMRVAGLVTLASPDNITEEIVAAAWLHDVVEDTQWGFSYLADSGIPDGVLEMIHDLTRPKPVRGDQAKRSAELIDHIRRVSWKAKFVKLADRVDNLGDLFGDVTVPKEFLLRYTQETRRLAEVFKGVNIFLEARLAILTAGIEQTIS